MKFAPIGPRPQSGGRSSTVNRAAGLVGAALLAVGFLIVPALAPFPTATPIPTASAACPDAEVDFARGREESPGVGEVGQTFINSLQKKLPHMSIGSYGVNYPADVSVTKGSNDMSAHVQSMAASCPNTK
jgi:cutinase